MRLTCKRKKGQSKMNIQLAIQLFKSAYLMGCSIHVLRRYDVMINQAVNTYKSVNNLSISDLYNSPDFDFELLCGLSCSIEYIEEVR